MQYTADDIKYLQSFREKIDYDPIKCKQKIKELLLGNKHILHVLNNKDLEKVQAEPSDYYLVNILPFYVVEPTQTNVQNFVTFQVTYTQIPQYNKAMKFLQVIFVVLCHVGNITEETTSLNRHDLLGALIQDQFNFTNICGKKIKLVEDKEIVVDNDYIGRQMVFEQITDNNFVRTKGDIARLSNKEPYAEIPQSED